MLELRMAGKSICTDRAEEAQMVVLEALELVMEPAAVRRIYMTFKRELPRDPAIQEQTEARKQTQ
jgi:hypothetical protein